MNADAPFLGWLCILCSYSPRCTINRYPDSDPTSEDRFVDYLGNGIKDYEWYDVDDPDDKNDQMYCGAIVDKGFHCSKNPIFSFREIYKNRLMGNHICHHYREGLCGCHYIFLDTD